jgi:hypothetical protein
MADLNGNTIAATYDGLLKTSDSGARGDEGSADQISDGRGNNTPLYLSATEVYALGSGSGTSHTAFGKDCGVDLSTGTGNALFGEGAGADLTTGEHNVSVGYHALFQGTTETDDNVAIGYNAMSGAIVAESVNDCVAIGSGSLSGALDSTNGVDESSGTVAIGKDAGAAITTGEGNVAIGFKSLDAEDDGDRNTAVGYNALTAQEGNTGTVGNTAVGYSAGAGLTNATHFTGVGALAGGGAALTGAGNTVVGYSAGTSLTDGADNIAVGKYALLNAAGADYNVAIGTSAMQEIVSGQNNVAVGYLALDAADGAENHNIAIGSSALGSANSDNVSANIAIGTAAMSGTGIQDISGCVAVGYQSLANAEDEADFTVAVGYQALNALTSGARNLAVGYQALEDLTVGDDNIAIGYLALNGLTTDANADKNIAIGNYVMDVASNSASTAQNVCIGHNSGTLLTGDDNTCIGTSSGDTMQAAEQNTIIGSGADTSAGTTANATAIGYGAVTQGNNSVTLGNASVDDVYMASDSDADIHAKHLNLQSTGNIQTCLTMAGQGTDQNCRLTMTHHRGTGGTTEFHMWTDKGNDFDYNACRMSVWSNGASGTMLALEGAATAGAATVVSYKDFLPSTTESLDLGSATKEWDNIFIQNAATVSDERHKEDIEDTSLGLEFINKLRPVSFKRKDWDDEVEVEGSHDAQPAQYRGAEDEVLYEEGDDIPEGKEVGDVKKAAVLGNKVADATDATEAVMETVEHRYNRKHQGLIAQEVKKVLDDMSIDTNDFAGYVDANINDDTDRLYLRYTEFIAPLIKSVQELSAKVEALENA